MTSFTFVDTVMMAGSPQFFLHFLCVLIIFHGMLLTVQSLLIFCENNLRVLLSMLCSWTIRKMSVGTHIMINSMLVDVTSEFMLMIVSLLPFADQECMLVSLPGVFVLIMLIMLIMLITLIMPLPGVSQRGLGGHPCRGVKLEQRRYELLRHFAELGHLSRRI